MIYFSWTIRSFSNDNSDGRDNALPHILPVATLTLGARGFLARFPVSVMPLTAEAKRTISVFPSAAREKHPLVSRVSREL